MSDFIDNNKEFIMVIGSILCLAALLTFHENGNSTVGIDKLQEITVLVDKSPIAKKFLANSLKETPIPSNYQFDVIKSKVNDILVLEESKNITGAEFKSKEILIEDGKTLIEKFNQHNIVVQIFVAAYLIIFAGLIVGVIFSGIMLLACIAGYKYNELKTRLNQKNLLKKWREIR